MNNTNLTEQDLEHLFGGKKIRSKKKFRPVLYYLMIFILVFGLSYTVINFPAFLNILSFWYKTDIAINEPTEQSFPEAVISFQPGSTPGAVTSEVPNFSDNHLLIPKISVNAPVTWRVANDEKEIQNNLQNGLIQIAGTAMPGESGNVFITGHSSNYWWKEGDYNTVFALLPQLVEGDEIIVTYKGEFHHYKVTGSEEMKSSEVSKHLESDKEKLTIMTCTPVGTNLRRLLVYADPI